MEMEGLNCTSPAGALEQHGERAGHQPRMALGEHRAAPRGIRQLAFEARQVGVMGIADGKRLAHPFPSSPFHSSSLLRDCLLTTRTYPAR